MALIKLMQRGLSDPFLLMPFSLIGSIFGSGINYASQKQTNATNLQIARQNNEYNYRMFKEQQDYNREMWGLEKEYNTPQNQAARLRAAGLNPALVMGGSNSGNASSVGGVTPPSAQPVTFNAPQVDTASLSGSLGNLFQAYVAKKQLGQTEERLFNERLTALGNYVKMMSEVRGNDARTTAQKILNNYLDEEQNLKFDNMRADAAMKKAQTRVYNKQAANVAINTLIQRQQLKQMPEQHKAAMANAFADVALKIAQTKNVNAATALTKENIQKCGAEYKQILAQTAGIKISNQQAKLLAPHILKRAKLDAIPNAEENYRQNVGDNPMQLMIDALNTNLTPFIPFAK